MSGADLAVLIMARAPRPGQVKTRLKPLLGAQGCARLQAALIARTVLLAQQVAPSGTFLAIDQVACGTRGSGSNVTVLVQRGDNLGARMHASVEDVLVAHHGPVAVIGTDAPTLTPAHLRQAAAAIADGQDAVFGPALDGGYYRLCLGRPTPELFAIDPTLWGGPQVLSASLRAAETAGLRIGLLAPLRDLDTPTDARAFIDEGELPAEIADLLQAATASR